MNLETKAVLLVGGLGTRLRTVVSSAPKPLAPVGNRPFLELLLRQLASQGVGKIVMCTGHLADQIEREFGSGQKLGLGIEYSREASPLGTGGALKQAQSLLQELPCFLVMNGDSFLEIDLHKLIAFHEARNALGTIAVVHMENAGRYGTVDSDSSGRIVEFREKRGVDAPGLINGGVYVFSPSIFEKIPDGSSSLEMDVFPKIVGAGIFALEQKGTFIDIGTPGDYAYAQTLHDRLYNLSGQRAGSESDHALEP